MTDEARKKRNALGFLEMYPTFARWMAAIERDMEGHGQRPRFQEIWRSPEDQLEAYRNGNSTVRYGFHNVTGKDGGKESLATDVLDDDNPNRESVGYCLLLASSARAHGCETGILWGLDRKQRKMVNEAIMKRNWLADIKIGWDPCHVQIAGMSILAARLGKRPK